MNKHLTNFAIDTVILLAFLVVSEPQLEGMVLHEWIGVALALVVIVHLLLHWDWIVCVGAQFFKKLWHTSRLKFIVDLFLFVSFVTVTVSGLMISRSVMPAIGLSSAGGGVWKVLHKFTGDSTLLLLGLHFALNWGWVRSAFKCYVIDPLARLFRAPKTGHTLPAIPGEQ